MTQQENQLAVIESVRGTALENYADRSVVRELMSRLLKFHPAAAEVGEPGMLMAAQIAILMGASPLPGTNEIHIWMDKGKPKVEAGINYWQRRGDQKGGVLWDIEPRPMTEAEREMYQITDGFYGAICRGVRLMDIEQLRQMGLSINQAIKMKGVTGIGVAGKNEYAKNGRPPIWTAIKRCKTDFFKMAFPFIPGEIIAPGAGMQRNASGAIQPDYSDPHWGAELSWEAQDEPAERSEFVQHMATLPHEEFNEILFGNGGNGGTVIISPDVVATYEDDDSAPLPDDEQVIMETAPAAFFDAVAALVPRYDNVHAAKNAAKKLGFAAIPKEIGGRLDMYRAIKAYAAERDAEEAAEAQAANNELFPIDEAINGAYQD